MLVSIITVYYNRENLVEETINSLLNQTYENLEIIAVNDGSTDNTLSRLEAIKDNRVKVINHDNWGFTRSIVHAIDRAESDIIAINGSGDYSYPTRIEKQLNLLLSDSRLGAVGCYVENINTKNDEKSIRYVHADPEKDQTKELSKRAFFTHGEVMFRKEHYNKAGKYREFFKYSQDRDLWLRMSLHSKFNVVNEVLYRRYNLSDGVSGSYDKSLLQIYFSEFAIQSLRVRVNNGYDYIDKYGDNARFFLEKNKDVANKVATLGIRAFRERNLKEAKELLANSRSMKLTFYNYSVSLLPLIASKNDKIYAYVLKLLAKMKQAKNKSSK